MFAIGNAQHFMRFFQILETCFQFLETCFHFLKTSFQFLETSFQFSYHLEMFPIHLEAFLIPMETFLNRLETNVNQIVFCATIQEKFFSLKNLVVLHGGWASIGIFARHNFAIGTILGFHRNNYGARLADVASDATYRCTR